MNDASVYSQKSFKNTGAYPKNAIISPINNKLLYNVLFSLTALTTIDDMRRLVPTKQQAKQKNSITSSPSVFFVVYF